MRLFTGRTIVIKPKKECVPREEMGEWTKRLGSSVSCLNLGTHFQKMWLTEEETFHAGNNERIYLMVLL